MPLGPFQPIPATQRVIRRSDINDVREALTGLADAYDVAVAEGFVGSRADFVESLRGPAGADGATLPDITAAVSAEIAGRNILEGARTIRPVLALSPDGSADAAGAVTPSNVGAVTTVAGTYGNAWRFTASGQYLQIGNAGYLSRTAGTVLIRARFDAALANGQTQSVITTTSDGFSVSMGRGYVTSLHNYAEYYAGQPQVQTLSGADAVPDGTLVTLALAWADGAHRAYLDGALVGSGTHTPGSADASTIYVGISWDTLAYQVESVLMFDADLAGAQVADLSALTAAHTINTTITTGTVTIPGSTLAVAPASGTGASTMTLQSADSIAHTLAVGPDGVLSVDGAAVTYRSVGALAVTRTATNITIESEIPSGTLLIETQPTGSANGAVSWAGAAVDGDYLHGATDDASPLVINGDTIGGNHGWPRISSYVVAGHDKTTADLGSTWTDGARTYTLLAISGTTLVFGHPYTVADGIATAGATPPAATLTHASGATHTTSVPITAAGAITQLYPSVRDVAVTAEIDGQPITADGSYAGDALVIRERYTILDYQGVIDWARSHVGTSYAGQAGVPGLMRVDRTYTYGPGGACVIATTLVALRKQQVNYYNAHQSAALWRSGTTLWRHMPGVVAKGGYDFGGSLVDMTSYASTILYGPADFAEAGEPPSWYVDWLTTGGVRTIGFAAGLLPDKGAGADAARAASDPTVDMRATQKVYVRTLVEETLEAGDIRTVHTFRAYLDPADVGSATALATVGDASGDYVLASYLSAVTGDVIPMDGAGRVVTAIKGAGLVASDTVGGDGVTITVPSAGHATLKVS